MLAAVHTLTGLAVASYVKEPGWILAFGVVAHFLGDMVPHWDDILPKDLRSFLRPNLVWLDLLIGVGLGLSIPWLLTYSWSLAWPYWLGGFAAMIPDGLSFVGRYLQFNPGNWFGPYMRFHKAIQWQVKIVPGLLSQAAVSLIMAYLIMIASS